MGRGDCPRPDPRHFQLRDQPAVARPRIFFVIVTVAMEIFQSQAARTVAGPEDSVLHRPYPACRGGRQNLDFRHMPVVNAYPALKPGRYEIDGIFPPDRLALGFGKEQRDRKSVGWGKSVEE